MLLKESTPSESQADAYEPIDRGAHIVTNKYHMDPYGMDQTVWSPYYGPYHTEVLYTPDKDFVGRSVPFFIICILLEFIFAPWTGTRIRLNDVLGSLTAGFYSRIFNLFGISASSIFYPGE